MSFDRLRTLTTIERIARVRESACRRQLIDAIVDETKQRECVEAVTRRQELMDDALKALCECEALDVTRMALYRDLADAIDSSLRHEQQALAERKELCERRIQELFDKTHYREGVLQRIDDATRSQRAAVEILEADARLDAWMLRAFRKVNHA